MSATTTVLRKHWKPALATGAGGTSTVIWFEEILLFFEEIVVLGLDVLALLALLLVTGPILLFNNFVFKSAMPKMEDKFKKEKTS